MKILREGRNEKSETWVGICSSCDCIAEAHKSELQGMDSSFMSPPIGISNCPNCISGRMEFHAKDSIKGRKLYERAEKR